MKKKFALAAAAMAAAALASATLMATPANAVAFTPNAFTPVGVSWVDVPVADRIYLQPDQSAGYYDDTIFKEIPAGITCDGGNIVGPALVANGISCVDGSSAAFEPTKIEFGFDINFYGKTISGGWPNSNASFTFDRAVTNYDDSIAHITGDQTTSGLYLGAIDLDYLTSVSNLWIARTTVEGHPAFVVTWENFPGHAQTASDGVQSVQAVIMDLGNGDFNAYLNTSEFSIQDPNGNFGYNHAFFLSALADANGTNVITVNTVAGFPDSSTCQEVDSSVFTKLGTSDLTAFDGTTIYAKLLSASDKTLSLFSDSGCSTPLTVSAKDVGDYSLLSISGDDAMPVGWGYYDDTTGYIGVVELFPNSDFQTLMNDGATPLINFSYNTVVPGRILLGMRNGQVATAEQLGFTSSSGLPDTGIHVEPWMIAAGLGLAAAGAVFASGMLRARRRGRHSA
jgi:hypothetical protein